MSWISHILLQSEYMWFSRFWSFVVTCTNKNMSSSSSSQISTLKISIPPITLILTLNNATYPTHHVYILGFSFHQFFSLLSTILFFRLPKLAFWTLFRAKLFFQLCRLMTPPVLKIWTWDLFHMFYMWVNNTTILLLCKIPLITHARGPHVPDEIFHFLKLAFWAISRAKK